jgi:LmbE family N-acetylglucosaminyl deacetylase
VSHAQHPTRKLKSACLQWATLIAVLFVGCRDWPSPTDPIKPSAKPAFTVSPGAAVEFYVHGAAEMWQIFMGNTAVASLQAGTKVVMVHTTAGDGGNSAAFWQTRESGALASVDAVLGTGAWTCATQVVNTHSMRRCGKANAVVYFMRMPDGNDYDGTGYGKGSLSNLRDLGNATTTVDGATTYTSWTDFTTTLQSVISLESLGQPASAIAVHSPDFDRTANPGDHPDNSATADAVRPATQGMGWTLFYYIDYETKNKPINLSQAEHDTKQTVFLAYDNVMVNNGYASEASDPDVQQWLWRTYYRVISSVPPAAPTALLATSPSKARVDLQWTDNTSIETGVWIERAPDANGAAGAYEQIGSVGANVTSYPDVAVHPGTKYWYRVRAFNDGGASDYSNSVSVTTPASTPLPYRADAYIVAHADDWQIFMGDHAYTSFQSAASVLFVYVTAGDAGKSSAYWMARERGALSSIDAIIGAGAWSCANQTVRNHPIYRCMKNSVAVYFMRLPDGNYDGSGFGLGTIMKLRDRATPTAAIDGSTTYNTWSDLYNTIGAIVDLEFDGQGGPYVKVHAQDIDRALNPNDHPDHTATGDAVTAAANAGHTWDLFYYVDYDTEYRAVNLTDAQHSQKLTEFTAYDRTMVSAGYSSLLGDNEYKAWLWRTYFRTVQGVSSTPIAPTNLALQPVSMSEIDLTWADNSANESGFNIERAPDNNGVAGTYAVIATVGANITSFASTGLNTATRYWYRVQAFNPTGNSPYTNASSATTLQSPPPSAPTNLALQPASMSEIDLTWVDNSADESGFSIERAPDNNGVAGTYAVIATVGPDITSFASIGLSAATRYWYRVRAFNPAGNSPYTNASSATTLQPPPPLAPSSLTLSAPSSSRIDLAWTDNSSDETGFRIERAPDAGGVAGTYAQIATVGAGVTTFSNTGLTQGSTFWYRVCAYNLGGCSAYSNQLSITTPLSKPNAPTGLIVTSTTSTSIVLSWADNATDETGYLVERAPDNAGVAGTFAQISSRSANTTTYTNTGLASSTTYWYRVRAAGPTNSDYSNIVSGTTFAAIPAAPSNLVAIAAVGHEIDLSWVDNSNNEASFTLQRAPDNNGVAGGYAAVATLAANTTTYANVKVAANTKYWYRLRATSAGGNSAWVVTNVTSLAEAPLPPTTFTATRTTSALTATLTWTDGSIDETGFRIEQAPDNGGAPGTYAEVAIVAANAKTYTASGLTGATMYWFRVGSYNAYGTSYVNGASVITALPTNLSVTKTTVNGVLTASLTWTPGTGAKVDVYRDGTRIKSGITNTGATTDGNRKAGTTNVYQVCNVALTGAAQCSNTFSITF